MVRNALVSSNTNHELTRTTPKGEGEKGEQGTWGIGEQENKGKRGKMTSQPHKGEPNVLKKEDPQL